MAGRASHASSLVEEQVNPLHLASSPPAPDAKPTPPSSQHTGTRASLHMKNPEAALGGTAPRSVVAPAGGVSLAANPAYGNEADKTVNSMLARGGSMLGPFPPVSALPLGGGCGHDDRRTRSEGEPRKESVTFLAMQRREAARMKKRKNLLNQFKHGPTEKHYLRWYATTRVPKIMRNLKMAAVGCSIFFWISFVRLFITPHTEHLVTSTAVLLLPTLSYAGAWALLRFVPATKFRSASITSAVVVFSFTMFLVGLYFEREWAMVQVRR